MFSIIFVNIIQYSAAMFFIVKLHNIFVIIRNKMINFSFIIRSIFYCFLILPSATFPLTVLSFFGQVTYPIILSSSCFTTSPIMFFINKYTFCYFQQLFIVFFLFLLFSISFYYRRRHMKKLSTTLLADVVPSETGKLRFTGFAVKKLGGTLKII